MKKFRYNFGAFIAGTAMSLGSVSVISTAALACGLMLASGCVHYKPRPIALKQTMTKLEARSLVDAGLRIFLETNAPDAVKEWPRPSWDLPVLTLAAFYYHPDLEIARAKLAAAEAAIITAGARPNPTARFLPTYDADALGGLSPWTLGFTLDVPIETAGKRGYRIAQARHLVNSARLNLANTGWRVRSRVRSRLLNLRAANLARGNLTAQQTVQNQILQALEDRLKAGESSLFDVQFVRVTAARTALQLRDANKQSAQAQVRLASALGVTVNAVSGIGLSFGAFDRLPTPEDAWAIRREALLHRADILSALSEYAASQSALQLEIARQYPDLHLEPGYAWDQGENKYSLGLSLTLPVLNQNQGPIAEAETHRRQAAAAFTALQARVLGETDGALAGYRDARRKLGTANELLAAQQKRMQSMQESFDAGASDRLELLQTQLELQAGELARAAAFIEAQQALGLLEDAMQRPADAAAYPGPALPPVNLKSN